MQLESELDTWQEIKVMPATIGSEGTTETSTDADDVTHLRTSTQDDPTTCMRVGNGEHRGTGHEHPTGATMGRDISPEDGGIKPR